jgi:hypothetical protein
MKSGCGTLFPSKEISGILKIKEIKLFFIRPDGYQVIFQCWLADLQDFPFLRWP